MLRFRVRSIVCRGTLWWFTEFLLLRIGGSHDSSETDLGHGPNHSVVGAPVAPFPARTGLLAALSVDLYWGTIRSYVVLRDFTPGKGWRENLGVHCLCPCSTQQSSRWGRSNSTIHVFEDDGDV